MSTYRALTSVVVAGKQVKTGATFETSDTQAVKDAVRRGLLELVAQSDEDPPKSFNPKARKRAAK